MLAPTTPHRYACPCGQVVLEVAGPSWVAWDVAAARAEEHGRLCPRAVDTWALDILDAEPRNDV